MSASEARYGMVIDLRRCVACHACSVTCKMENGVPIGRHRTWVQEEDKGSFPSVTRVKLPRLCNHCEDAPCEHVCPVNATFRAEGGAILVDQDRCVGCRYCIAACPYDARYIDPARGTVDKCTFCAHRTEAGLVPACVSTCIAQARHFGDLNDPESYVSKLVAAHNVMGLREELGTRPNVYYIGLDSVITGVARAAAGR